MTLPNDDDLAEHEQSGDHHPDDDRAVADDTPNPMNPWQSDKDEIWEGILDERHRQNQKYGDAHDKGHRLPGWLLIMERELQEAKAAFFDEVSTRSIQNMRIEILQVIATGVAALQHVGLTTLDSEIEMEWFQEADRAAAFFDGYDDWCTALAGYAMMKHGWCGNEAAEMFLLHYRSEWRHFYERNWSPEETFERCFSDDYKLDEPGPDT